ncbi:tryptophanase [Moorella naiadis]|uniref:tryptophanase n=1 Tax=Moorella naiadis (nom. illeg.) TaxID=3093670 RepID=UPI003D9CA1F5
MPSRNMYAEPFRIKAIETIKETTRSTREMLIKEAGYNVFNLRGEDVYIDLLTDSGTAAMSDNQWAGMMLGDESYAGCKNFYHLRDAINDIMGYKYVVPTHQGRAAENILMTLMVKAGQRVLGNMHFDTTEGHILIRNAKPVNLVIPEGKQPAIHHPFKGNFDLERLEAEIKQFGRAQIPFVLITVTCNNNGGQPVAMANIRGVREIASRYGIPVYLDAARYAENCYFIKMREPGYQDKSIKEIAREMFSYADGCTMSAKKDALVNIGGFLAFKDDRELYEKAVQVQITYEGFRTYGGLAGRDLEAIARGLYEGIDERYLENRIRQVAYLGEELLAAGIPIIEPPGGHGIYVDVKRFLSHLPQAAFPAQALVVELYLEAGIRAVELGTCAFGYRNPETGEMVYPEMELVRLAIPRRVYTDRHMDLVVRAFRAIAARKERIPGLRLVYEAPVLRHFTARFEMLSFHH